MGKLFISLLGMSEPLPNAGTAASDLFWLHNPADVLTGLAFLALAALALASARRRPPGLAGAFCVLGLFAVICGFAHFAEAMAWVTPVSWYAAALKLITAAAAWAAVVVFVRRDRSASTGASVEQPRADSKPAWETPSKRLVLERFGQLLEAAPDPMLLVEQDGEIVLVNAQTEKLFGYQRQELLGKPADLLVPKRFRSASPDQRSGYYTRPPLGAPQKPPVLYGLRKDGTEFPVEVSLSPLETPEGTLYTSSIRDISERVRAQVTQTRQLAELTQAQVDLRQQTSILQSILDSMGDGVIVADQNGKILCFNPAAELLLGIAPFSATPAEWTEQHGLYLPDSLTPYPACDFPLARAMRGEAVDGAEIFVRPAGSSVGAWLMANARPLRDEPGLVRGGVAVFRDITDRVRTETAVRQQTDRMKLLQLAAVSANCAASAEDALQVCLDGICAHIGWPVGHLCVRPDDAGGAIVSAALWHLSDAQRFMGFRQATEAADVSGRDGLVAQVFAHGKPEWIEDVGLLPHFTRAEEARRAGLKTGVFVPVMVGPNAVAVLEFFASQAMRPDPSILMVMAQIGTQLGRIVERQRAAESLRQSEELSRSIIETANDAFIAIDDQGMVTDWNQQAQKIFGWQRGEVLGRRLADLIIPEPLREQHRAGLARYLATGEGTILNRRLEVMALHRSGQTFPVELTAWPVRVGQALRFNAFVHDITERRRAEEQLKDFAARLGQSNRELQDFASVASHDLQEPLRKVQAFGDRLRAKCHAALDEPGRDYLDRMQNAASRMRSLIDDLLMFSRVSSKAQPFVPTDLGQVAQEVVTDLEVRIQQTGGQVEVDNLPTIDADPLQMRQLLQNLIGNGLKFHRQEEAPAIRVRARLVADPKRHANGNGVPAPLCELSVADNGIGFDMKYSDRLFHVFHRLHGRGEYEGTGMGLAICRRIAERHGGSIAAHAAPGRGATFTVTLPVKQPVLEART